MHTQQTITAPRGALRHRRSRTFSEVLDEWLENKKGEAKPTTCAAYQCITDNHIRQQLGNIPVGKVSDGDLSEFMDGLVKQDLSPSTTQGIANVLHQALKFASSRGCCANAEICRYQKKCPKPKIDVLSPEEQKRLLAVLGYEPSGLNLGILLALKLGMRVGEVCALRWEDVLFDEGLLHIRRTVQRINASDGGTWLYVGDPKSLDSDRKIPLTPALLELLSARRGADGGYIISKKPDRPVEPRTLQRHFKRTLRKAGLRDVNFHVLRHSFATKCVDQGFDVKSLSMILGHASVSTTMNIYVHPSMERMRTMMIMLDD
ncbi:MAG: site-specific integrase [Clostridia bacterium]|nr:site-specific integrase [Clostridia bacterium]